MLEGSTPGLLLQNNGLGLVVFLAVNGERKVHDD